MTAEFLANSKSRGNDLSTPVPEFGFPGLKPGDRWCLCAPRWQEAFEASQAPRVVLRATHEGALTYCKLADLKPLAVDLRDVIGNYQRPTPFEAFPFPHGKYQRHRDIILGRPGESPCNSIRMSETYWIC